MDAVEGARKGCRATEQGAEGAVGACRGRVVRKRAGRHAVRACSAEALSPRYSWQALLLCSIAASCTDGCWPRLSSSHACSAIRSASLCRFNRFSATHALPMISESNHDSLGAVRSARCT